MSVHTHIIDEPNYKLLAVLKEMKNRRTLMEKHLKKNKTLKGIEDAIGIKFIRLKK